MPACALAFRSAAWSLGGVAGSGASRARGGGVRASRVVCLALALPLAVLARLAVPGGLAAVSGLAVRAAPVRVPGMVAPVEGDQQAAPVAAFALLGKGLEQSRTHPLAGHLHQPERGHLG